MGRATARTGSPDRANGNGTWPGLAPAMGRCSSAGRWPAWRLLGLLGLVGLHFPERATGAMAPWGAMLRGMRLLERFVEAPRPCAYLPERRASLDVRVMLDV